MAEYQVRTFDVSDPRKSFAGHTVYRVSSKVYHRYNPEVEEVIVWRRFSEFRKLHKELCKLYDFKNKGDTFPTLPKATFFDRFDEAIIEERRKSCLDFLNFVGVIQSLSESQSLSTFLGEGIRHQSATSSSSRSSSLSSIDSDTPEHHIDKTLSSQGKNARDSNPDSQVAGYLELGGVWLCKQPSLVEGLDSAGTMEDTGQDQAAGDSQLQSIDVPRFLQRSLSIDSADENDVFEEREKYGGELISDSDDGRADSTEKASAWLQRAMSLCSEGEDIEALASEAENDEFIDEVNFPKPFSEHEEKYNVHQCHEECDPGKKTISHQINKNDESLDKERENEESTQKRIVNVSEAKNGLIDERHELFKSCQNEVQENLGAKIDNDIGKSSTSPINKPDVSSSSASDKSTNEKENGTERYRFTPRVAVCAEGDYLFSAANVVRQALQCELDGQYKEAFHLYKKCVSLLLNGVQEEKDSKRREAVRRKTAQYLLKAEALYTAYRHDSQDLPTNTAQRFSPKEENNSQDVSNQLKLSNFSVIGVIGKVILVENNDDKNTYVIKVLPKTEDHRFNHKSKGCKRRKHPLRAAYSKCPFIISLYQHCHTQTSVLLLLEYARGGLLWDHLTPRQHKSVMATSKSQCYVHNLKETEIRKRPEQLSHNTVLICDEHPNLKHTEGGARLAVHNKVVNSDGSLGQSIDKLNINEDTSKNAKKISIFAPLDEYFSWSSRGLTESNLRVWMAEIILAVAHLHLNGIICRDLNPKNVLLNEEGHVLLTHFSVWEGVDDEPDLLSLNKNYCAPELFKLEEPTITADWWSVGALFHEILTGKSLASCYPWGIRLHTELEIPDTVSAEASSLIRELLLVTPSERLGYGVNGVDDIKSHPYFSGIDWSTLTSVPN